MLERCQIQVGSKCMPWHLRVQIQAQRRQRLRGVRWLSGRWVLTHFRVIILLPSAALKSPGSHAWGCFRWLNPVLWHMQSCWPAKWYPVKTSYFLSLFCETQKESCCLPSCESFIGLQLRMGQTLIRKVTCRSGVGTHWITRIQARSTHSSIHVNDFASWALVSSYLSRGQ